jgi:hypothetical protein
MIGEEALDVATLVNRQVVEDDVCTGSHCTREIVSV